MSPRNSSNSKHSLKYSIQSRLRLKGFLKDRRSNIFKLQIVLIALLVVLGLFLVSYWAGNGFSTNDNIVSTSDTFLISLDKPIDGATFVHGQKVIVSGGVIGGTIDKVNVWNQDYNVGVPASTSITKFGLELYADDFSEGQHVLCVQARSTEGEWSKIASVMINVDLPGEYTPHETSPIVGLFQPIIDIVDGITGHSEAGTGDNDLNGDNIDDRFQTTPLAPRYNPMNLPMTNIIIFAFIIILVVLIVYLAYRYLKGREETKEYLAKYIASEPLARRWYLNLSTIRNREENLRYRLLELRKKERELLKIQMRLKTKQAITETERIRDRQRFINMMRKLEKEKDEIQKKKGIKILISPKLKAGPGSAPASKDIEQRPTYPRPVQHYVGHPANMLRPRPVKEYDYQNRGVKYGRNKKKTKRKKK